MLDTAYQKHFDKCDILIKQLKWVVAHSKKGKEKKNKN